MNKIQLDHLERAFLILAKYEDYTGIDSLLAKLTKQSTILTIEEKMMIFMTLQTVKGKLVFFDNLVSLLRLELSREYILASSQEQKNIVQGWIETITEYEEPQC